MASCVPLYPNINPLKYAFHDSIAAGQMEWKDLRDNNTRAPFQFFSQHRSPAVQP